MMKYSILMIVILISAGNIAFASRVLDTTETLEIVQTLTDNPLSTWIPYGTIEAKHIEYSQSTEAIVESTEKVKFDGDKFYWEINISPFDGDGSNLTEEFASDLKNNTRRVFVWDGSEYTMYFDSSKNAMIFEDPSGMPINVNGPLTAGIVPWGFGVFTYDSLSTADLSAQENYQQQIILKVNKEDSPEMEFLLDPSKNYAVIAYSLISDGLPFIKKTYSDFQSVNGKWIPSTIVIERYDQSNSAFELLSRDEWEITAVSTDFPQQNGFDISYKNNTFVEFRSPATDSPLSYHFSDTIDARSVLTKRLQTALTSDDPAQNCATVAMTYVLSKLQKESSGQQLAQLVNTQRSTNLYDMRQLARNLQCNAATVNTDLQTLKNLQNVQVILYLPGSSHYVILDHIDSEYVWLVDLSNDKFYYSIVLDDFKYLWSSKVALLISNDPLGLGEGTIEISDDNLRNITGRGKKYSCTLLIQKEADDNCIKMGNVCSGRYRYWYERYGCIENENGGVCVGQDLPGMTYATCVNDDQYPEDCTTTGDWYERPIRACK
jgi:Peptidase C39 family